MEACAVWVLVALALLQAWRHGVELFVAWYSGSEPLLPAWRRATVIGEIVVALVAVAVVAF